MGSSVLVGENGRGVGRIYFLWVEYFAQARTEIDRCGFTVVRSSADPSKNKRKTVTELKPLPKVLSEVSVPESFWFMEGMF